MIEKYSPDLGKKIIEKFHKKGWNLYRSDNMREIGYKEVIRQNLAESLEINSKYVLLPVADEPQDPKQVMDALEVLAQRLNREMPTIKVGFDSLPFTGLTLKENSVKIHTPYGTFVTYSDFLESLDSVVQTQSL